jgi:hypothetical protein
MRPVQTSHLRVAGNRAAGLAPFWAAAVAGGIGYKKAAPTEASGGSGRSRVSFAVRATSLSTASTRLLDAPRRAVHGVTAGRAAVGSSIVGFAMCAPLRIRKCQLPPSTQLGLEAVTD